MEHDLENWESIWKVNKILSQKLAKRAMNLVSKKDHNQCKISYMRKKYIFCNITIYYTLYTINNLCVVIEIIASYFHIVSSKKFLRTSSSPHKTLPNDIYDAPKDVCGERKLFYRPLKKCGQKQISGVRALTLCS